MIYILSGLLTGGVLTAICWPLFQKTPSIESTVLEETEWDLLQRKKEVVLGNIQDLDFEFKCGKLSEEDHKKVREELIREASEVFQAIDRIEASQDLDSLIRRAVVRRKTGAEDRPSPLTCPACGHPNTPKNKFCAECGTKLTRPAG